MEKLGTRAVATFLAGFPALAYAQVSEVVSLVSAGDKFTAVTVLLGGLYVSFRVIMVERKEKHTLRNQLVNHSLAREMWKSAYLASGLAQDHSAVQMMLDREERLIRPPAEAIA